jgi:plasmid stabilization system protein ParE
MGIVRLSHLADADLDEIREYIQAQNPTAANEVIDKLFDALESLAEAPELGERREDFAQNLRAFAVRPYVIFYYSAADGIHVARIIHGARDYPALFR